MTDVSAPSAIAAALAQLPGWRHEKGALLASYTFAGFDQAMAFMQDAAEEIARLDHHPDWSNLYATVTIRCTTHDAGDVVTVKDIELAKRLHWVAQRFL